MHFNLSDFVRFSQDEQPPNEKFWNTPSVYDFEVYGYYDGGKPHHIYTYINDLINREKFLKKFIPLFEKMNVDTFDNIMDLEYSLSKIINLDMFNDISILY